jgi:hypothetical protein
VRRRPQCGQVITTAPYPQQSFVANNRRDFLKEYARLSVHDAPIILVPMVERDDRIRLFGLVPDHLQTLANTVNKLVEILSDGEIRVQDWSASNPDPGYVATPGRHP